VLLATKVLAVSSPVAVVQQALQPASLSVWLRE